jgi:hypothetical protein
MATEVKSLSSFYSTNLNPQVNSFSRLADRIAHTLGYPLINIDVHRNQLYEYISISCEMFSKFAGYTEEWLVFDSSLYETGKGIRLDKLFAVTPELNTSYTSVDLTISENNPRSKTGSLANAVSGVLYSIDINDENDDPTEYVIKYVDTDTKHSRVSKMLLTTSFNTSAGDPLSGGSVTYTEYGVIHTSSNDLISLVATTSGVSGERVNIVGTPNATGTFVVVANDYYTSTTGLSATQNTLGGYDALIENYRKVVDVYNFEEGTSTGVNTLFTIEQTLAQQTYFSYSLGNYGFDLISWYTLREWLDTREKMLTQKKSYKFNPRTQYLQLIPQPRSTTRFYGILGCYLEKPLIDLVKEQWVYQYALALTKIGIGHVRSKYSGTAMLGGGSLSTEILAEGKEEKEKLEERLYEGTPGFGDADPPMFFVG